MTGSPSQAEDANGIGFLRRRWQVRGIVQGVGFRPWICRLARELDLPGEVGNDASGVWIEAVGPRAALSAFAALIPLVPGPAKVEAVEEVPAGPSGETSGPFRIAPSRLDGNGKSALSPDLAPCLDCLRELHDPTDRRQGYPFLACSHCGPRYTITGALPYDRTRTSLAAFSLCPDCLAEYSNPDDRRFHAEAIACPRCGPSLQAVGSDGRSVSQNADALTSAAEALTGGLIVAVQAAGGFQLWVDASRPDAVRRLRERKNRPEKPLAVMVRNVAEARQLARVTDAGAAALSDSAAPIVLLPALPKSSLAPEVAGGFGSVGLCLPASPLQALLLDVVGFPVVATSGNSTDEPLCFQPADAIAQLGPIADLLLVHDREILHPADDSVIRFAAGRPRLLRRARGFAPSPVCLPRQVARPGMAGGGQLKSTLALVRDRELVIGPHIGDLGTVLAQERHAMVGGALCRLLRLEPEWVACDSHPDYTASLAARAMNLPRLEVQHHHAHLLAVLAEQKCLPEGPVLGVIWDGSGHGPDGTVWGGEFLLADGPSCRRVGHLRRFALPGGEQAVREPRRSAFAWLWETLGPAAAAEAARRFDLPADLMGKLCDGAAGTPRTSSAGRLFDAVAALCGLCSVSGFEGRAAMLLEDAAAAHPQPVEPYPFVLRDSSGATTADVKLAGACAGWELDLPVLPEMPAWEVDTGPMAEELWGDVQRNASVPWIAARFHRTLSEMTLAIASQTGIETVVLGGGCFQNAGLLEATEGVLCANNHTVLMPEYLPSNDGGLSAGQAFAGAWLLPPP